ncbi:MAG: catalase [Proteobacteria bacterium]|nr:catalase [Pseudomonadota bacterium]
MNLPSTEWRELIKPDEDLRFARYAEQLKAIQTEKSKQFGDGRALHRKQLLASQAEFEVYDNLPAYARFGLFNKPGIYAALVRLSNGSISIQPDRVPDIRGFAIKIQGIEGPGALGGTTRAQDFLLINREVFGLKSSQEFMELVLCAAKGGASLLSHYIKTYGIWGGTQRLKSIIGGMRRPFTGFATERFYSSTPIACGPYAVRVRMLPASTKPSEKKSIDWAQDMQQRLSREALTYKIQLQFYINEDKTPIEDGNINWEESDAPYQTVGELRLPKQEFNSSKAQNLATVIAHESFDPWCALMEHRPLGEIMRARKNAYFISQNNRQRS